MNGNNYLLDTNFILGILKSNSAVIAEVSSRSVYTSECLYSVVARMELLGYHGITVDEECPPHFELVTSNACEFFRPHKFPDSILFSIFGNIEVV
jgi:hypothetical protein